MPIWAEQPEQSDPPFGRWPTDRTVFHCTFDQKNWDKNFDQWPDGWTRHHGPGYPIYLQMKRIEDAQVPGGGAFRIQLDGGAAAVFSPSIPIHLVYAYVVEVLVKTEGLQHHQAFVSLNFRDARGQVVDRYESEKVTGTRSWQKVRLGPVEPKPPEACSVQVGLHVEPGDQADLKGSVSFADVWLGQLPRLKMWVQPRTHLFAREEEVEIFCEASGFSNPACQIEWELQDVWGRILARQREALQVEPISPEALVSGAGRAEVSGDLVPKLASTGEKAVQAKASVNQVPGASFGRTSPIRGADSSVSEAAGGSETSEGSKNPAWVYRAKARWRPVVNGPGFYRVGSRLVGLSARTPPCQLDVGVLGRGFSGRGGEFGWSLPGGGHPLPLEELGGLLPHMGIRWVKYPVWFDLKAEAEKVDAWVVFSERLTSQGIEMVGMLARPPASIAKQFATSSPLAADIFAMDPAQWWPGVEPLLVRLAPRVHWWQLGMDDDQSFVGYPQLAEKMTRVKNYWEKVGKGLHVGFGWDWMYEMPKAEEGPAPWKFLALRTEPPLTPEELADALASTSRLGLARWVVVEPLPKDRYSLQERAGDLVQQMAVAKIAGAEAVFLADPFHPQTGLMHPNGTVDELLLVWRTMAQALAGAQYLGRLPMPNRSPNYLFLRDKDALLIVWNEHPTEEVLYLGDQVERVDLWGRAEPLPRSGHSHRLEVSRLPCLVRGLDPAVAQWRMQCHLEASRIPSLFGRPHPNSLILQNPLDRGVSGTARLLVPSGWSVQPEEISFRLGPGEKVQIPFHTVLPYTATNGRYPLPVEIHLQADRWYRFEVYEWIDVGLGDVYIQIATRFLSEDELEVEQRLVNETEHPVAFVCQLFAPGRKRYRTHVFLSGTGQEVTFYRFPNAQELIGKTLWLHAVEIGGHRVLNYRFSVPASSGPARPVSR